MSARRIALVVALAAIAAAIVLRASTPPRIGQLVHGTRCPDDDPAPPPELAPPPAPMTPTLAARPQPADGPDAATAPNSPPPAPAEYRRWSLLLRVEVVDAESGRPLGAQPPPVTVPVRTDGAFRHDFVVEVPEGFATWDAPTVVTTIARRATTLRHLHPLRPEAFAFLSIHRADGTAVRPASPRASVGGRDVAIEWDPVDGRVRRLPFLPGVCVQFTAPDSGPGVWEGRFGVDRRAPVSAELTLLRPTLEVIGIGSGASGGAFTGRGGRRALQDSGRVEVTVRDRDGRPLADTSVWIDGVMTVGRTDSAGVAVFEAVPEGDRVASTIEPGVVAVRTTFRVRKGETTRVAVRESDGGTVDVQVVDEAGEGVPFATLTGIRCDLSDDGVQRTDPYTDDRGRRTLTHVNPGPLTLTATLGDRKGSAPVEVRDRERTVARIVVR